LAVEPAVEHPRHARALFGIGQLGIAGIDIGRQPGFLLQPMAGILEGRHDESARRPSFFAAVFGKTLGV
jgi:hypothetical protein